MNIVEMYLPQHCYSTRDMASVDGAIIHYVSARNILPDDPFNLDAILQIFRDYSVSAHYLIDREDTIYQLVPMPKRAYHAGKSIMNGRVGCNNFTIGIELMGGIGFDYTESQMAMLSELLARLMVKNEFKMDTIKGHDEVRSAWNFKHPEDLASVKTDPGAHFPWLDLRATLQGVSDAIRT